MEYLSDMPPSQSRLLAPALASKICTHIAFCEDFFKHSCSKYKLPVWYSWIWLGRLSKNIFVIPQATVETVIKVSGNKQKEIKEEKEKLAREQAEEAEREKKAEEEAAKEKEEAEKEEKNKSHLPWGLGKTKSQKEREKAKEKVLKQALTAHAPAPAKAKHKERRVESNVEQEVDKLIDNQDNVYVLSKPK